MMTQELSNTIVEAAIPELNFHPLEAELCLNKNKGNILGFIWEKGYRTKIDEQINIDCTEKIQFAKDAWNTIDSIAIVYKDEILTDFSYNQNGGCWLYMLRILGMAGYKLTYVVPPKLKEVSKLNDISELALPIPTCEYHLHNLDLSFTCLIVIPEDFDSENYNYVVTFHNRVIVPENGVFIN